MDPAQPHFSNTDPLVRLDPTDAIFVDVIHTDAIDHVTGGFGMEEPVGAPGLLPERRQQPAGLRAEHLQLHLAGGRQPV